MIKFSARLNNRFVLDVFSACLIEEVVDWVGSNLTPEEVFSDSDLEARAESNRFIPE